MKARTAGFSASAALHGLFALLFYTLVTNLPEARPPTVIDLSLLASPTGAAATKPAVSQPLPQPKPRGIAPLPKLRQHRPSPPPRMDARPANVPIPMPAPIPVAGLLDAPQALTPLPPDVAFEPAPLVEAPPAEPDTGPASLFATGTGGREELSVEERWRREHFGYIKEVILRNLTYPVVARRNGWQGRVLVCFEICLDGGVENLRIEQSSSYALLDQNVIKTIRQAVPFPNPPVRATLVVPIDYRLN